MYKGIYLAASGAVLKQTQLEVVSQNIANANTTGFKKDDISFQEYLLENGVPDGRTMTNYSTIKTNLSNGTISRTGNPLDIAVEGGGLIALEGGRYTRRGDLRKNSEGMLVTASGTKVLGSGGGPISIPADAVSLDINTEGKVSVMQQGTTDSTEIDTIKIVEFGPDAVINRAGDGLLTVTGGVPKPGGGVKQGYLEASNVDAVKEMVRMIELMREFESYQKVIQTFDDAAGNVNNNLGRL